MRMNVLQDMIHCLLRLSRGYIILRTLDELAAVAENFTGKLQAAAKQKT